MYPTREKATERGILCLFRPLLQLYLNFLKTEGKDDGLSRFRFVAGLFHRFVSAIAGMDIVSLVFTFFLSAMTHIVVYGWITGAGYTLMLFFHEAGHVIALIYTGYLDSKTWWMIGVFFVPFLGAILRMNVPFHPSYKGSHDEALVGIAGPFTGITTTFLFYVVWLAAPDTVWLQWTWFGDAVLRPYLLKVILAAVTFNLFNILITVSPFDGGRIAQAISPFLRVWVGPIGLCVVSLVYAKPWVCLIWMFGLMGIRITKEWTHRALGMTVEWTRAFITVLLASIMAIWMTEEGVWHIDNIISLGMGLLTAISAVLYAIGSGVPVHALPLWRFGVITVKKAWGTYIERGESTGGNRLGDGVKPNILPDQEWTGRERRNRRLSPRGVRVVRKMHFCWGVKYVVVILLHFLHLGAVLYSFARF